MDIGVDIIEVSRIKDFVNRNQEFLGRIFTEEEIRYCEKKRRMYEHFAARFAAKEAVFKALGTGWIGKLKWNEIEVRNEVLGKPEINLYGTVLELSHKKGIHGISLSLSHCREYAVAMVLLT